MKTFSNILAYAEAADPDCLQQVVALARQHGAALSVCDVIEPSPTMPDPLGTITRLKTVSWQLAFERLRNLCAPHMKSLDIDYSVLTGNPFLTVTEQVIQQRFDLVVHISEPVAGGRRSGLNPTGMHLVRKCPCAVWSMHRGTTLPTSGIVLAVDRDVTGTNHPAEHLTRELAATAQAVAVARRAPLHIVHAWTPFGEALLRHPRVGLADDEIETYTRAQEQDHRSWLDALVARMVHDGADIETHAHLVRGSVTKVVPELAQQTGAGLIVMGTIGTSAVPGVLIGTSAEAILSTSETPILALKPQGFTSPLRFSRESTRPRIPAAAKFQQGAETP